MSEQNEGRKRGGTPTGYHLPERWRVDHTERAALAEFSYAIQAMTPTEAKDLLQMIEQWASAESKAEDLDEYRRAICQAVQRLAWAAERAIAGPLGAGRHKREIVNAVWKAEQALEILRGLA